MGFPGTTTVSNEELVELPCDILVPSALEGQITGENAPRTAQLFYSLSQNAQSVRLSIVDINGQTVRALPARTEAGLHAVTWDLTRGASRLPGAADTSSRAITETAGVNLAAITYYFGSKDDLLHEVYARVLRMQTDHLVEISSREAPVAERVHAAAADVIVTSIANLDDTKIFFRSMHQLAPEKQRSVRAERRKYHEIFRSMVEQGQSEGVFRTDVPADLVVDYFFGSVHHLGTWYRHDGQLTGEDVGRHFADLLVAGLRPQS